jgi:hypothetical protein
LSNLQLVGGSLNEAFKPATFAYTADLDPGLVEIEIVPTATSRRYAALKINGVEAVSGQPFAVPPQEKATSTTLSIEVLSPDRSTANTYTLSIHIKG